eukprot:1157732-Pelagomonas_calceolata.AAC.12
MRHFVQQTDSHFTSGAAWEETPYRGRQGADTGILLLLKPYYCTEAKHFRAAYAPTSMLHVFDVLLLKSYLHASRVGHATAQVPFTYTGLHVCHACGQVLLLCTLIVELPMPVGKVGEGFQGDSMKTELKMERKQTVLPSNNADLAYQQCPFNG